MNNNACLEPKQIIDIFDIIQYFLKMSKETFGSGLLSLTGLTTSYSKIEKGKNQKDFLYLINHIIQYIINNIITSINEQSLDEEFLA